MAFTVPTFNIVCEVWSGPWLTKSFRFESDCNLAFGRRVQQQALDDAVAEVAVGSVQMGLLLPKGTNIRDNNQGYPNDIFEVPAASGRWYQLIAYDDVGGGFENEYRLAVIVKISQYVDPVLYAGLQWPLPCPSVGP